MVNYSLAAVLNLRKFRNFNASIGDLSFIGALGVISMLRIARHFWARKFAPDTATQGEKNSRWMPGKLPFNSRPAGNGPMARPTADSVEAGRINEWR